jgi:hypothetical protein
MDRRTRLLIAAAATLTTALVAGAIPGAAQAKHCRVCRVPGSLSLQLLGVTPEAEGPSADATFAGRIYSKQKLCRNRGGVELWRRLTDGSTDHDIGNPIHAQPGSFSFLSVFNIDDGSEFGNVLIRYPPGSTVEYWAVLPKEKRTSGIIGSPIYKCQRFESPHLFVPVPNAPPSS